MVKPWKLLDRWEIFKNKFITLRTDRCELPDGRVMPNYFVLDFADWVNVVPVTKEGELVMIKQYRHGLGEICLEVPGGSTQDGARIDAHLEAGKRELLEETGYTSSSWEYLGNYAPNPALQSNLMHVYLALDCEKTAEPQLDPFEDISIELMPIKEVYAMAERTELKHSMAIADLFYARPKLQERFNF